jgi:hypothetical protein
MGIGRGVDKAGKLSNNGRMGIMRRTKRVGSWRLMLAAAVVIASAAGCDMLNMSSSATPAATAGTAPPPNVQDCIMMNVSSPSKYVCNGKTYTTFQLATIRMKEEKK